MDTNYQASTAPVGQVKTNRSLLESDLTFNRYTWNIQLSIFFFHIKRHQRYGKQI